jgi:KUP system potassium uptake protein
MVIWYRANIIKMRLTEYVKLADYIEPLKELSRDMSIPKYATHLVFMSNAARTSEIESKIIYSIFQKRPKRADIYWFVHVDTMDDPYTMEYKVGVIEADDIIKVNFRLGFRVEQRINLYFRKVVEDMVKKGEVDNKLSLIEGLIMKAYFFIKDFTPSEDKWFGLDTSAVKVEKVPLIIRPVENVVLKRVD